MTSTPDGVTDPHRTLETQLRVLEDRVAAAELAIARVWVVGVSALLVLGQLLPFLTYTDDGEEVSPSLLTFGLGALTYTDEDGHRDAFTVVLGVAFTGLSLLALIALVSLAGILRRTLVRPTTNRRAPIAVLLVVGVVGAWLTLLVVVARENDRHPAHVHAGLAVFTAGALLYAWLVVSEAGRELWVP